ncbi:FAD-dependent oxidoreductase [Aestuariimicrobium kwangyangense]|uniref:FAD-dependent oxidoreductase n=1 Tax=Aestuariimicrobium kwangyangense TaxID=396389 RepID=UPI00041A32AC|nr:FAD-dependent oxidoreductase [Aestuariimicrobium kwangyangense]
MVKPIPADRESMWWAMREQPAPTPTSGPSSALPSAVDVLVIGAGVTGLSAAVELARGGRHPVVVEAWRAGAGATGHTTAKVSLLQGDRLQRIRQHASAEAVRSYVEVNRIGQGWLLDLMRAHGEPVQARLAVTYAVSDEGAQRVHREAEVAREAGLAVLDEPAHGLPFTTTAAISLADQAQVDPMGAVDALRAELEAHEGELIEGVRVTGLSGGNPWTVHTSAGDLRADAVIMATQTPVGFRGAAQNAVSQAKRSYAIAYPLPSGTDPESFPMSLSLDASARSLRTAVGSDGPVLLVGGAGHLVGEGGSTMAHVAELDAWAREHFDVGEPLWSWSAQDYLLATAMPFIGALPVSHGTLLTATGYDKWGMALGAGAGLIIAADLLGDSPGHATAMRRHVTGWHDAASIGAQVAKTLERIVRDRVGSTKADEGALAEGQGRVEQGPIGPRAVSTVDGRTCSVSAVCTHLGGVLAWNDVERSWDCPLHGSRFASDGTRLEGPATADLSPVD